MASYIDSNLTMGEVVIKRAKISPWSETKLYLVGVLLLLLGLFLLPSFGFLLLFFAVLIIGSSTANIISTQLVFTNKRLIAKYGILSIQAMELDLDKIESIQITQGMFGRLFNFGSLTIRGTGGGVYSLPCIVNPIEFKNALNAFLKTRQT